MKLYCIVLSVKIYVKIIFTRLLQRLINLNYTLCLVYIYIKLYASFFLNIVILAYRQVYKHFPATKTIHKLADHYTRNN